MTAVCKCDHEDLGQHSAETARCDKQAGGKLGYVAKLLYHRRNHHHGCDEKHSEYRGDPDPQHEISFEYEPRINERTIARQTICEEYPTKKDTTCPLKIDISFSQRISFKGKRRSQADLFFWS